MNQIEERPDGSRWMQVRVATQAEWRELETRTQTYKYIESRVEYTATFEQPKLKEGEALARMADGSLVIVRCWLGESATTEAVPR
ncbi:MAG: hypothetical protein EOP39_04385 [Rubrivivax sp.]|nr:MAG: hypothetical protein EOP39_04385 [Rubrivivax sp.]